MEQGYTKIIPFKRNVKKLGKDKIYMLIKKNNKEIEIDENNIKDIITKFNLMKIKLNKEDV